MQNYNGNIWQSIMLHKYNVEKCFRDARLTQIYEGTNQINRLVVIEEYQNEFLALGDKI